MLIFNVFMKYWFHLELAISNARFEDFLIIFMRFDLLDICDKKQWFIYEQ